MTVQRGRAQPEPFRYVPERLALDQRGVDQGPVRVVTHRTATRHGDLQLSQLGSGGRTPRGTDPAPQFPGPDQIISSATDRVRRGR